MMTGCQRPAFRGRAEATIATAPPQATVGCCVVRPQAPPLTRILRAHLRDFGTAPGGRVFAGVQGGELPSITYRRAWDKARRDTLSAAEYASPLARHVYDLRHACVSTWLNGGIVAA
jgi:integrase